mmetsp:Transcript_3561/g.7828  ORF Transcript_3561/g.7828 Transcript_3561/m.7828 type:complete len:266 (-) Transcript_3561:48-845(-)
MLHFDAKKVTSLSPLITVFAFFPVLPSHVVVYTDSLHSIPFNSIQFISSAYHTSRRYIRHRTEDPIHIHTFILVRFGSVLFVTNSLRTVVVAGRLLPLAFLADLRFLLGAEFVANVENGSHFGGRLSLDRDRDIEAGQIEQGLDVHKVGGGHQLEQQGQLDLDKLGVPGLHQVLDLGRLEGGLNGRHGLHHRVVPAKFDDLREDNIHDVHQGNFTVRFLVLVVLLLLFDRAGDQDRHLGHGQRNLVNGALLAHQLDDAFFFFHLD